MGEKTEISWATSTFNPWLGCEKVSPECKFCYAERDTKRWGKDLWGPDKPRALTSDDYWKKPLAWNRKAQESGQPWRVFSASQSDIFEVRPDLVVPRSRLMELIEATPALTWMLLTKRPENILGMIPRSWVSAGFPRNVWLGTTVGTLDSAEKRIPHLLRIPSRVRFLSCEPLLEEIDLVSVPFRGDTDYFLDVLSGRYSTVAEQLGSPQGGSPFIHGLSHLSAVSWVIVGGESGPHARPMHPQWARSIRDACERAGVPFFFKQQGEWLPRPELECFGSGRQAGTRFRMLNLAGGYGAHGELAITVEKVGPRAAGALLDGREHKAFPSG